MSSHGDHYEVTALQLATLVSAIGNGGKLLRPYIVRTRQDETRLNTKVRRHVKVDREVWSQVVPGLVGAVNYGSGKRAQDPQQQVAGKTGTCIENGTWVGLFTSYAPVLNPKLAVVVITRGADARGHFPAAVAGRIYRELGGQSGQPSGFNVASSREPNSRVTRFATDEEETALEDEAEYKVETSTVFRSDTANPSRVKPVLMSIPVPRDVARPTRDDAATTGGQTRPRRVLGE
jgi:membrane peptidoglycan carboxypeptidase